MYEDGCLVGFATCSLRYYLVYETHSNKDHQSDIHVPVEILRITVNLYFNRFVDFLGGVCASVEHCRVACLQMEVRVNELSFPSTVTHPNENRR